MEIYNDWIDWEFLTEVPLAIGCALSQLGQLGDWDCCGLFYERQFYSIHSIIYLGYVYLVGFIFGRVSLTFFRKNCCILLKFDQDSLLISLNLCGIGSSLVHNFRLFLIYLLDMDLVVFSIFFKTFKAYYELFFSPHNKS